MKRFLIILALYTCFTQAQTYAPQVGFDGTTAIHKDSSVFIDWANLVTVTRGYKDIAIPQNGYVDYGISTDAIGEANTSIVSLGDGGEAILTFNDPIVNGEGADFAIFENGFLEEESSEFAFLELAFVEVSTDGVTYIRFPSISENLAATQIASFGFINARYIQNLAGKYIQDYGTPFDLSELIPLTNGTTVDLSNINFIKIIDVVGTIDTNFATYDSENNIINDPYPSEFSSGGFDLNAVGVIHNATTNSINDDKFIDFEIYPNPTITYLNIATEAVINKIEVYSIQGKILISTKNIQIDVAFLPSGIYFISVETSKGVLNDRFVKN